eukprot:Plantae.Rhodophyta-Purpureofilum_apyrenoidigerum.ctg11345.p1 GENE.Plantae.Rhodophyta-Purpureofilum_apyrenoidigerum.ctg11345~~Plantae.Rhodophyta-Purpureofilum_apyrenoidigerum.ctg11345.p1  ORF type:complete len:373 (-),score=59.97 Plantae.Rhodophyta-Purpureofilum_apyrenoidigerum.ctg11345:47-1165(-)
MGKMTETKFSHLLSPIKIGPIELSNRVALSPMTRARSPGGVANDINAEYYTQRASAGLVITEGTFVSDQAIGWLDVPGIYKLEHVEAWKKVTDSVHKAGGKIVCQLWHCGRASHSSHRPNAKDGRGIAPSPLKIEGHMIDNTPLGKVEQEVPREMTTEECENMQHEFKHAAQCAKDAGFDGIEIHSANGYLLDTFLQSKTNKRTDKYGGSLENRFRMLKEVVEAALTVWEPHSVNVRLSPNIDYNDMGSPDFRESFLYYIEQLSKYNLGYLHLLIGLAFGFHKLGEPFTLKEAKKVYPGIIMANCGYTPEDAERDIASGDCDMVSFGRPYISNPDLVPRIEQGIELEPMSDHKYWWTAGMGAEGYTDFPFKT